MIRVGIIGGAGYTAGELLRLLLHHPDAELAFVRSNSHAGQPLHVPHPDLIGDSDLLFSADEPDLPEADLLFLCSGHGAARAWLDDHDVPADVRIIDLSNDFRLKADALFGERRFVYGLPEVNREEIRTADTVANPGCFATLIQLALLPAAAAGLLGDGDVHVHAVTGSTGAGAGLSPTTHFTWREGNLSVYKPFAHQHLGEIGETIGSVAENFSGTIRFIPVRGNHTRGIFASLYTTCAMGEVEVRNLYEEYYADHPFTLMSGDSPDLKRVVNTNKCLLHAAVHGDQLLMTGAIDNLLKGAAGQAVQNMNLMFGLDERTGLGLKGSGF